MSLGFKGKQEELVIRQGADFGPLRMSIKNYDGTPYDLTGCTFAGVLTSKWNSLYVAMYFNVTIFDAVNGIAYISANNLATSQLAAGESENDPVSKYQYQIDLTEPSGKVIPIFYGPASVFRQLSVNAAPKP